MTVPVQTPAANHVGNGVTTTFPFGFKLLDEDDVTVMVNSVEQTLGFDYSVSGVGIEAGGDITFAFPPSSLAEIAIFRQVAINRLTDYQYSGDFQSLTVNRDFDRLVMMMQDSGIALANAVRLPPGDPNSGLLPGAVSRALMNLGFNAEGALTLVPATAGDATALALALASASLPTQGTGLIRYKPAPTGAVSRLLTSKLSDVLSVLDFGAEGDGVTNDTIAIQKALDYLAARGSGALHFPGGHTYKAVGLTWTGVTDARLCLFGDGPTSRLMLANTTGTLFTGAGGSIDICDMEVGHLTNNASTAGYVFNFTNSFTNLRRIDVYNGYNFARWGEGCDQGGAVDVLARGVKNDLFTVDVSPVLPPTQQHGNITFERIRSQAYGTNTGAGFRLVSGDGMFFSHIQVHGYQNGLIAQPSASRSYLANLFFDQFIIDGAGGPLIAGPGAYFDGTNNPLLRVYFSNSWIGSIANGRGLYAKNTKVISWRNGTIIDNATEGAVFDVGCEDCSLTGSVVTGNGQQNPNTYSGILVNGADGIIICDNRVGATINGTDAVTRIDTQKYGIHVANASTINYAVYDNDVRNNLSGGFQDGGGAGGRKVVRDN